MGTPKLALRWDFGMLAMKFRIMIRKLTFTNSIMLQDDKSLAKQVLIEQMEKGWPGLANEVTQLWKDRGVSNILTENLPKMKWKKIVKKKVKEMCEKEMKNIMKDKTKVKKMAEESFEVKDYIKSKSVEDARTLFRVRSGMTDIKMIYLNKDEYIRSMWRCDSCKTGAIESQSHVLHCPAYRKLREGKDLNNDKDVIEYFRNVLNIRSKLNILK